MKKFILFLILLGVSKIYGQSLITDAATNINQTTATLNATASGLSVSTTYKVEFYYDIPGGDFETFVSVIYKTGAAETSHVFSVNLTGLTSATEYNVYTYLYRRISNPPAVWTGAIANGSTDPQSFTTAGSASAPTVTTTSASNITTTTATIGGNVTADGGATVTNRGVCYSLTSANSNPQIGGSGVTTIQSGSGTGAFSVNLSYLKPGAGYSFKAYGINSVDTTYGSPTGVFTMTGISQASNIGFNTTTVSQTNITFSVGGGTGRLVLARQGGVITITPTDGADYTGGSNTFGSGTNIGDNTFVIAQGSITSLTMTGLSASTTYYIQVYEYTSNGTGGYYYQPSPASGSVGTLKSQPTTQGYNISFSSITASTFTTNWTRGNGDGIIVLAKAGAAVSSFPADGTDTYNANPIFGSGSQIGSGNYVIYKGTGTGVNVSNLIDGTAYHIRVFEYNNSGTNINYFWDEATLNPNFGTTAGPATWIGGEPGSANAWGVGANWSTGVVPNSSRSVIIPNVTNKPEISTAASSSDITIQAGAWLTIENNGSLSVNGNLLLESPSGNGAAGQLVIPGTGTISVSGSQTMQRYTSGTVWRDVSSPETTPEITDWNGFYANSWNATSQQWQTLDATYSMSVMQGLAVRDGISASVNFVGPFNNGQKSISVTGGAEESGWNLVGNPYPSAINWGASSGINKSAIQSDAYVYNSAGTYNSCSSCTIAAGQGFWVHSTNGGTLSLDNPCRIGSSQSLLKSSEIELPKITLQAKNDFFTKEAYIGFNPDASADYDQKFDAYMLMSPNDTIADIYTLIGSGSKLVSNTLNAEILDSLPVEGLVIPIGLTPGRMGSIELSASEISNISESIFVYLHDNVENKYVDLRQANHEFFIDTKTNDRFELVLKNNAVGVKDNYNLNAGILIYTNKKSAFIKSDLFSQNNANIYVYDIMGKLIVTKPTYKANVHEIKLNTSGAYIIKVVTSNKTVTQKVVVQ